MYLLRPVCEEDLDAVLELSGETTYGLTTLPRDASILERRIRNSVESFARLAAEPVAGDEYFLVLEELESESIVGTSAIVSKVGGFKPFYAYRIETSLHESETLGVSKEIRALHLVVEHDGPSEIGTLFLSPRARRGGAGRLLSLGRFLLIAEHRDAFDPTIIAEMRGVIDDDGHSAFWEAVGQHFFDVDLPTADYKSVEDKSFIADLMPTHPIYIPILPQQAQDVIGRVHALTEPALHLLEAEGFRESGMVDIFEAGPVIECARDEIRSVRESRVEAVVEIGDVGRPGSTAETDSGSDSPAFIVCNRRCFRATVGTLAISESGVAISADLAAALDVGSGDQVRFTPLRASSKKNRISGGGA